MAFPDRRTLNVLLTTLFFAVAVAIVYVARTVIVIFAFSILFAYLINPIVRFLQRHSLFFKNLRGPHVLEAYLAIVILAVLCSHARFPDFRRNAGQLFKEIPVLTDNVSSGEIATRLGSNMGWADEQTDRIRIFLRQHPSNLERAGPNIEQSAPAPVAGIFEMPLLAILFLIDGENLANQIMRVVATEQNHAEI